MFLRLPSNLDVALRRLKTNGLEIVGPADADDDGVRLTKFSVENEPGSETKYELVTEAVATQRKHTSLVQIHPDLARVVGFMPPHPQVLEAGDWGPITVVVGALTDEQQMRIADLPWLVKLRFAPVTSMPD
jgi:hypothetical protein